MKLGMDRPNTPQPHPLGSFIANQYICICICICIYHAQIQNANAHHVYSTGRLSYIDRYQERCVYLYLLINAYGSSRDYVASVKEVKTQQSTLVWVCQSQMRDDSDSRCDLPQHVEILLEVRVDVDPRPRHERLETNTHESTHAWILPIFYCRMRVCGPFCISGTVQEKCFQPGR